MFLVAVDVDVFEDSGRVLDALFVMDDDVDLDEREVHVLMSKPCR